MKRNALLPSSRPKGVLALAAFSATLLAIACSASPGDSAVSSSSSELYARHWCESTGACSLASSESACIGTSGCAWGTGNRCASVCPLITTASACNSVGHGDAGYESTCEWVNGACAPVETCPTSDETTKASCEAVKSCAWSESAAFCEQATPCPLSAVGSACLAANDQCTFVEFGVPPSQTP
jgi:hypothetical protein